MTAAFLVSCLLTLYILTSQCSVVYASSRTSSSKSLFPISAFRTRSKPGGRSRKGQKETHFFLQCWFPAVCLESRASRKGHQVQRQIKCYPNSSPLQDDACYYLMSRELTFKLLYSWGLPPRGLSDTLVTLAWITEEKVMGKSIKSRARLSEFNLTLPLVM